MVKIIPPPRPDLPADPGPGMALHIYPAGHVYWLEDFEYYDQLGRDPLQQAGIWLIKDPDERVAKLEEVLEKYPKQKHRRNLLFDAALRGDDALVRCIVATGVKVHPTIPSALTEEQKEANDEMKCDGEMPDTEDTSVIPLHAAAVKGHLECLKIMLEEGTDAPVDARDVDGRTPLIAGAGSIEVVRYLLGQGADPTARSWAEDDGAEIREAGGNGTGRDALETAAANEDSIETLRLLLEHPFHGSTRKRKSRAGEGEAGVWVTPSAIQNAAGVWQGGFEALTFLLEKGAYPLEGQDGKTKGELLSDEERKAIQDAIPYAAADGSLETLKLLLSYQYPTDDKTGEAVTPFDLPEEWRKPWTWGAYSAIKRNSVAKFEFLHSFDFKEHDTMSLDSLPQGQKLNIQHLLDIAAEAGAIDCLRHMINKYGAEVNKARVPSGVFPLYMAAGADKTDMVNILLAEYGADIHLGSGKFATGPTALWIAIGLKAMGSIELLLRHGGPVESVDELILQRLRNGDRDKKIIAILRTVRKLSPLDTGVYLESEETAAKHVAEFKADWQNFNSPYVRLELEPADLEWIEKLQPRRPAEELREKGDAARELNEEEALPEDQLDPGRRTMVALPTIGNKQDELDHDDDIIPQWRPYARPA